MDVNILWGIPFFALGMYAYHFKHVVKPARRKGMRCFVHNGIIMRGK